MLAIETRNQGRRTKSRTLESDLSQRSKKETSLGCLLVGNRILFYGFRSIVRSDRDPKPRAANKKQDFRKRPLATFEERDFIAMPPCWESDSFLRISFVR